MHETFKGRTALITGASAGLGREFARQLGPVAGTLVLVARRAEQLSDFASELRGAHPGLRVLHLAADVAVPEFPSRLDAALAAENVEIDLLVNNAGLGDYGTFSSADPARIEAMLATNIGALVRLTRHLLPGMLARRRGWVLQVSSVASLLPLPTLATYAATKAFVTSFSEGVRLECAGSGVCVTALLPGPVDTEFSSVAARRGEGGYVQLSPGFFKVTPGRVVRCGLEAVAANRPRIIPGWIPRICMTLAAALPLPVVRAMLRGRSRP
jgi:short-subunit dehydrogenase